MESARKALTSSTYAVKANLKKIKSDIADYLVVETEIVLLLKTKKIVSKKKSRADGDEDPDDDEPNSE